MNLKQLFTECGFVLNVSMNKWAKNPYMSADVYGHADVKRRLAVYTEKDCVLAYLKGYLGLMALVKLRNDYRLLVHYNGAVNYVGGYGYTTGLKVVVPDAIVALEQEGIIVNPILFKEYKSQMVVEAI